MKLNSVSVCALGVTERAPCCMPRQWVCVGLKNVKKRPGKSAEGKMEKDNVQYSSYLGSLDNYIYLGCKTVSLIRLTVGEPKTLSLWYITTSEFSGVVEESCKVVHVSLYVKIHHPPYAAMHNLPSGLIKSYEHWRRQIKLFVEIILNTDRSSKKMNHQFMFGSVTHFMFSHKNLIWSRQL